MESTPTWEVVRVGRAFFLDHTISQKGSLRPCGEGVGGKQLSIVTKGLSWLKYGKIVPVKEKERKEKEKEGEREEGRREEKRKERREGRKEERKESFQ